MAPSQQALLAGRIKELISRSRKGHRTLSGGLKLAYNPNPAPNLYRLLLMRPQVYPSDLELEIVRGTLVQVLRQARRPFADLVTEPYLANHKYKYHVIQWREYRQLSLLSQESLSPESLSGGSYEDSEQSGHVRQ